MFQKGDPISRQDFQFGEPAPKNSIPTEKPGRWSEHIFYFFGYKRHHVLKDIVSKFKPATLADRITNAKECLEAARSTVAVAIEVAALEIEAGPSAAKDAAMAALKFAEEDVKEQEIRLAGLLQRKSLEDTAGQRAGAAKEADAAAKRRKAVLQRCADVDKYAKSVRLSIENLARDVGLLTDEWAAIRSDLYSEVRKEISEVAGFTSGAFSDFIKIDMGVAAGLGDAYGPPWTDPIVARPPNVEERVKGGTANIRAALGVAL